MILSVDIGRSNRRHFVGFVNHIMGDGQLVLEEDVRQKSIRCLEQLSWTYIVKCILTTHGPFSVVPSLGLDLVDSCGYFVRMCIISFLFYPFLLIS